MNRFPMFLFQFIALTILWCLLAASQVLADDFLWTGAGGNSTWNNSANWINQQSGLSGVPASSDHAIFGTAVATTGGTVGQVTVTESGTLTVTPGIITTGTLHNNGITTFQRATNTSLERIRFNAANSFIAGTGELTVNNSSLTFSGGNKANIQLVGTGNSLTNAAGHTIVAIDGGISLINNHQTFFNNGILRSEGIWDGTNSSSALLIGAHTFYEPVNATQSFINNGTLSLADRSGTGVNVGNFENNGDILLMGNALLAFAGTRIDGSKLGSIEFQTSDSLLYFGECNFDIQLAGGSLGNRVVNPINVDGNVFITTYHRPQSPIPVPNWLNVSSSNGFEANAGEVYNIFQIGGESLAQYGDVYGGTFAGLAEGAVVGNFGVPLRITYRAGDGNDIALVSTFHSNAVNFNLANNSPTSNVFFAGERGTGSPAGNLNYNSFELLRNQQFTLGPEETLNLANGMGTLIVNQGSIFNGNGVVNGNILNSGLIRIPIVQLQTVSQTQGGVVQVSGTNFVGQSMGVNANTYVSFQGSSPSSGWTPTSTLVSNQGTIGWDASLAVAGDFTQTGTGALRLFVAGENPGVNYSQLLIGGGVDLNGALQIVFDLEKFAIFDYQPEIGQTFDFIVSGEGINLDWSNLQTQIFLTVEGSQFVEGLTLSSYNSGILGDPDRLLLIDETMFSFALVDEGRTLRGTLIREFSAVPEPSALIMLGLGGLGVLARRRRQNK